MSYLNLSLRTVTGVAIATILSQSLAGCSGVLVLSSRSSDFAQFGHLDVPAAVNAKGSAAQRVEPDAGGQQLFVSDNENNRSSVFNAASTTQNPPPTRTITQGISGPNGIATDLSGNLYVANYFNNTVPSTVRTPARRR